MAMRERMWVYVEGGRGGGGGGGLDVGERERVASTEKWSLREQPREECRSVMPTRADSTCHGAGVLVPLPKKM